MKQEKGSEVAVAQRASDWYDSLMSPRFLCLDFLSETTLQTALKKALKNRAGRRSFLITHFLLGLFSTTLNPFLLYSDTGIGLRSLASQEHIIVLFEKPSSLTPPIATAILALRELFVPVFSFTSTHKASRSIRSSPPSQDETGAAELGFGLCFLGLDFRQTLIKVEAALFRSLRTASSGGPRSLKGE